jgi:hypothetical protein
MHESTNRSINSNRLLNNHSSKLTRPLQEENAAKKIKVDIKSTNVRSLF